MAHQRHRRRTRHEHNRAHKQFINGSQRKWARVIDWEDCSDAEVAALSRALHEARFADEPNDPLVWSSPVVIDLHVAALAEAQRRATSRRRAGGRTDDGRRLWSSRPEASTVARRLARNPALLQQAREDGGQTLRDLLRPFILDDADVGALLEHVEAQQDLLDAGPDQDMG